MIVFITHPKYFSEERLKGEKNIEVVFIFNSFRLYTTLSKKYSCVLLNPKGEIQKENFFPPAREIKKSLFNNFFEIKKRNLRYFRKIYHHTKKKYFQMLKHYKDVEYDIFILHAKKRKSYQERLLSLDKAIVTTMKDILTLEHGEQYIQENIAHIQIAFNYAKSFHRAYAYSFAKERGVEVFTDYFRSALFF